MSAIPYILGLIILLVIKLAFDYWSLKNKWVDAIGTAIIAAICAYNIIPGQDDKLGTAFCILAVFGGYICFRLSHTRDDLLEDPRNPKPIPKIKLGYFENFKGGNTLLFFGTAQDLTKLSEVLFSLCVNETVSLENDGHAGAQANVKVLVRLTEKTDDGMRRSKTQESQFEWTISEKKMILILEKIYGAIATDGPCHNYLDGKGDEVQVMISKDEYPDMETK